MISLNPTFRLPTLERLGASLPLDVETNANHIAKDWFSSFTSRILERDVNGILNLFCEDAMWRDALALTWDLRTFDGSAKIMQFLTDCLSSTKMQELEWKDFVHFQKPFPDMAWIVGMFNFETAVGLCSGVFRLVPTSSGEWKAFTMFSNLEDLKHFPESIGPFREQKAVPSLQWDQQRQKEVQFADSDPSVLIVGGGQSGLGLAARLKYLNVPTLVVEKDPRIGDSWRKRYDRLCLHSPVWFDNMPYLPFPPTWPKYTPGSKMADWLENYANILDLNVWTSSTVLGATQESDNVWSVRVQRQQGDVRVFHVKHFVFATGQGDAIPRMPNIPNTDVYRGELIHSSKYKRASDFKGKRVLVIGSGNSAHDICSDLALSGIDVTMFQRSPTFVMNLDSGWKYLGGTLYNEGSLDNAIADKLIYSIPHLLQEGGMSQRATRAIVEDQKKTLDGLKDAGFKLNLGIWEAGILLNLKQKGGGHYFDTGASQLIIDKLIKLKNDSQIESFHENGLQFEDGSKIEADAVICATGCGDMRNFIQSLCGDTVADECPPLLGVDDEGELSWFRALPRKGLWYMVGNLSINRFYSKHVALQIKAMDENIIGSRYAKLLGPNGISLRL